MRRPSAPGILAAILAAGLVLLPQAGLAQLDGAIPPPPAQETPMPREGVDDNAATSPEGNPNQTQESGTTNADVQADAPNQPTPQGTRAPREETSAETGGELYPLLQRVRIAPPSIDGRPQPRPNPLASEPETEMTPDPRGNPEHLFPEGYVE